MKLTGGEIDVKQLTDAGVPYIIGIPGHGVLGLFDAIRKADAAGTVNPSSFFTKSAGSRAGRCVCGHHSVCRAQAVVLR